MIIKHFSPPSVIEINQMDELEKLVFGDLYRPNYLQTESQTKSGLLATIAYSDGQAIGFKIGYSLSQKRFYSWAGGVRNDYRSQGVATALMAEQHQKLKELGYTVVRTQTKNRFRSMLLLNIRKGFDIIGTFNAHESQDMVIMLEKNLNEPLTI